MCTVVSLRRTSDQSMLSFTLTCPTPLPSTKLVPFERNAMSTVLAEPDPPFALSSSSSTKTCWRRASRSLLAGPGLLVVVMVIDHRTQSANSSAG